MMSTVTEIPVRTMDGKETTLDAYKGKVALVVNVASKCGFTPQYEKLEALYQKYRDHGFVVLGFPANDFMQQEPGTDEEIQGFCSLTYGVDFPLFSKITVTGEGKHPLYKALTEAWPTADAPEPGKLRTHLESFGPQTKEPEILWNFEKFLLDKNGHVVGRFTPDVEPNDPMIIKAIETELAK
jgi:glutathione peroxidase